MIAPDVRSPDIVQRVALLGMRFRDSITARAITDGLAVNVSDPRRSSRSVSTVVSSSGVHVLHDFPGLATFTRGAGDRAYWHQVDTLANASPPRLPTVRVRVDDLERRFMPARFDVVVPHEGLLGLGPPDESPPSTTYVVLYSRASRPLPAAKAVLRAQLYDDTRQSFAAWAMASVTHAGIELARAFADERGTVAVCFDYPEFPRGASPSVAPPLGWNVQLRVGYAAFPADDVPDLAALHVQPLAHVLANASPASDRADVEIGFGIEQVVRTPGSPFLHVIPQ